MSTHARVKPFISPSPLISHIISALSRSSLQAQNARHSSILLKQQYYQRQAERAVSTVTEYRPHTLEAVPPPPRNTSVPDTSITGLTAEISSPRPLKTTEKTNTASSPENSDISVSEGEAQKSKPVTPAPKSARTSRLRSRKAAMSLTSNATIQLRNLLALPEPKFIRVGVKNRGCSGLAYHLEYVDRAAPFDEAVEQDGVKVLIDSKALFSIIGSEMDWVEDKLNQRFVFRNPNIKEQCGCGESFMV